MSLGSKEKKRTLSKKNSMVKSPNRPNTLFLNDYPFFSVMSERMGKRSMSEVTSERGGQPTAHVYLP